MRRPTRAIVEQRTVEILRIMLDGAELYDLCEYVHEQAGNAESCWYADGRKLSRSQVYRYSQRAWKKIYETTRVGRRRLLKRHLAMRKNLIGKSIAAGDLRTALAAMESEARLCNLHEPQSKRAKIEANTPSDVAKLLSARLAEIEASDLPASERAKLLTAYSDAILRAHSIATVEQKVEEMLTRLVALEERKKK